jgi:hypothetical protein
MATLISLAQVSFKAYRLRTSQFTETIHPTNSNGIPKAIFIPTNLLVFSVNPKGKPNTSAYFDSSILNSKITPLSAKKYYN